jgi:hypothetical protein
MDRGRRDRRRHHERCIMKIEATHIRSGKYRVTLRRDDGSAAWTDELTPTKASDRKRFVEGAKPKLPELEAEWLEAQLLELADRPAPANDENQVQAPKVIPEDPLKIRVEALEMLGSGDLMDEIRAGIGACGLACDLDPAMIVYLSMTSRLLDDPLSVFAQGPSSTGKTFIGRVVAGMMPPEEVIDVQDVTPQVLYYMGDQLQHRCLLQGEWCRSDEQSENGIRTQAMRQLISDQRITKLFTNTESGKPVSEKATTEGPVAVYATSTLSMSKIFEEDENRFLFIHTDETKEATRLVLERQAETAAGIGQASEAKIEWIRARHRAMQREIRRQAAPVVVPFANQLKRRFPTDQPRRRRDFMKLLGLVKACALLHHRQRSRDAEGRIVAQLEDYRHVHGLLAPFMVKDGPTPATLRKYEELKQRLDLGATFKRVDAEEVWGLKKQRASELIRELRDARLLEDASGLEYTYRLKDAAGERTTFLPEWAEVASGS